MIRETCGSFLSVSEAAKRRKQRSVLRGTEKGGKATSNKKDKQ